MVFVLLCALTNFVAKTVDFVELIQGVRKRPRSGIEIYPRKCRGVVFVVVISHLYSPFEGNDFQRTSQR